MEDDGLITINCLPLELIGHIALFLDLHDRLAFSATNASFNHEIFNNSALWNSLNFTASLEASTQQVRAGLRRLTVNLVKVDDETFLSLFQRLSPASKRNLKSVNLDFTSVSAKSIQKILQACPNLENLSIYGTLNAICKFSQLYSSLQTYSLDHANRIKPLRVVGLHLWHPDIQQARFWEHEIVQEKEMGFENLSILSCEPECQECGAVAPCMFPKPDFEPLCHDESLGATILTAGKCPICNQNQKLCPDHLIETRCCVCSKSLACPPCRCHHDIKIHRCRCDGMICQDCAANPKRSKTCRLCQFVACPACARIEFGDGDHGTCQTCFMGGYIW